MSFFTFAPNAVAHVIIANLVWVAATLLPFSLSAQDLARPSDMRMDVPLDIAKSSSAERAGQTKVGYLETVIVNPGNLRIDAKVDTGALSSSIDATNIGPFLKDGRQWVRFTVVSDGKARSDISLPVVRIAEIRRANTRLERRFVVELDVCLGGVRKKSEVTLADRRHMRFRMLIGRSFAAGDFIVDPNGRFLTRPDCRTE